jgi:hypothetical protein
VLKKLKEKNFLKNLGVDGKNILNWFLKSRMGGVN